MNFFANLGTGFSAEPGLRTTFWKHNRFAPLAILFALLALSLGCGLIGGDAAAEEEFTDSDQTVDSENLTETAALADTEGGEGEATEAAALDDAEGGAGEATEAAADPEAAAEPVLVQDPVLARDLAWATLSQCVTLNSIELEATLINGEWFIAGSAEATRPYGFWKVDAVTGAVIPHDNLSASG